MQRSARAPRTRIRVRACVSSVSRASRATSHTRSPRCPEYGSRPTAHRRLTLFSPSPHRTLCYPIIFSVNTDYSTITVLSSIQCNCIMDTVIPAFPSSQLLVVGSRKYMRFWLLYFGWFQIITHGSTSRSRYQLIPKPRLNFSKHLTQNTASPMPPNTCK